MDAPDDQRARQLLQRIARHDGNGSRHAFDEFWHLLCGFAQQRAQRILLRAGCKGDIEREGEEVVQQAMADIWEKSAASYDGRVPVKAWVHFILRNKAIDLLRRGGANEAISLDRDDDEDVGTAQPELISQDPTPYDQLSAKQTAQMLRHCVEKLPDLYRDCIELCLGNNSCNQKEMAAILGCPEGTIKSRMTKARALLAACLQRRLGKDGEEA